MRGATIRSISFSAGWRFQSTRPVRGATAPCPAPCMRRHVSIHAPRAGRDRRYLIAPPRLIRFNPRAPCGARLTSKSLRFGCVCFNPRAPCGARHLCSSLPITTAEFQSTRPVRGATPRSMTALLLSLFQSTRPVRGATRRWSSDRHIVQVSIHAPRAGRDRQTIKMVRWYGCFNPRAPCGARPHPISSAGVVCSFNPRAPCGARLWSYMFPEWRDRFNPRAPCGARR